MVFRNHLAEHKTPLHVLNALSVDVEEYFQVEAFSEYVDRNRWEKYSPRIEEPTLRLLDILDSFQVKGTFFVLGWLAERNPTIVKRISEAGHEIASHGYEHVMVTKMTPDEFRNDIRKSKQILESVTHTEIQGYRAPTFSIVEKTKWVYPILLEEGFRYSSSVFPIWHDRYGWPEFGYDTKKMVCNNEGDLWEIPLSVGNIGSLKVPFGGGGYLRAYPNSVTMYLFRKKVKMGLPVVVYVHPWELDRSHPKLRTPFLKRFRHYLGISSTENKLLRLLTSFKFGSVQEFLRNHIEKNT